jgi:hypothetical protein
MAGGASGQQWTHERYAGAMGGQIPSGAGHRGVPEHLLLKSSDIYRWRGRRMGRTIFNAHKGTLILTDHRLVYVASGGTDVWWQLGWAGLGFVPGMVGDAASYIDNGKTILGWFDKGLERPARQVLDLGPPELLKDGSVVVPLAALEEFGVVQRRLSSYLWIAFHVGGQPQEYTFSDKIDIPGGAVWEQTIVDARAALRHV